MAIYSEETFSWLQSGWPTTHAALQSLQERCIMESEAFPELEGVREHLTHGAARRVGVFKRALEGIYTSFPPESDQPPSRDDLSDAGIYLHAFMINLSGFFDNLAWAFVLKHELLEAIGGRRGVGLFTRATSMYLPQEVRGLLGSDRLTEWREHYVKNYRDALAHRIPPYIPPVNFTDEEQRRYRELNDERIERIKAHEFDRVEQIEIEQAGLGSPCPVFMHSFTEDGGSRPIALHPQVLTDAQTVVEIGNLFFDHWGQITAI